MKFPQRIGPEEEEEPGRDSDSSGEPPAPEGVGWAGSHSGRLPSARLCGALCDRTGKAAWSRPRPHRPVQSQKMGLSVMPRTALCHRAGQTKSRADGLRGVGGQGCSLGQRGRRAPPRPRPGLRRPRRPRRALTSAPQSLPTPAGGDRDHPARGERRKGGDPTPRHTPAQPHSRGVASRPQPLLLCAVGAVARATVAPRPGPAPRGAPSWSRRCRPPRRSPQEPPPLPAAGRHSGAVAGSRARLSAPVRSPALACPSPRRSAGRVQLTSSPSGSEPRLHGRRREPPTSPCPAPPVCQFGPCR